MSELREKLMYKPQHGYDRLTAADEQAMEAYCADYRKFLDNGKTERPEAMWNTSPVCPCSPAPRSM